MQQQEFQAKYQKLTPQYQKKFQEQQKEFFDNTIAEFTKSDELPRYRQIAMMHTNENKLGVDYKYWQYIFNAPITDYRYNDLVMLLSTCEALTLKDWLTTFPYPPEVVNKSIIDWTEFRTYISKVSEEINPFIDKHTNECMDKLLRTQHLDISGQSKSIPLDHKVNPLLNKR